MGDDALAALISEAKQISRADSLQRISVIFQCIDHLLSLEDSTRGYEAVGVLRTLPIFPTRRGEARPTLQTCERHDDWFIADQPRLLETFYGRLNMLAFGAEDLARMSRLFCALHIEDRLLSTAAICKPRQGLASVVREDYKRLLLSKAEYLSCLARNHGSQPSEVSELLRDIEVQSVDEVIVEWAVLYPSEYIIDTHEDTKLALIVREDNRVQLYIRHIDADADNLPFELCEQLSELFGIPSQHRTLLWAALLLNDIELLREALGPGNIFRTMSLEWQQMAVRSEPSGHRTQVSFGQSERDHSFETGYTQLDDQDNVSIAQLTDSHYQHRVPRFTAEPDVIFCSTVEELPDVDFEGKTQEGQKTLPARLQMLNTGMQTLFIARSSTTLIDHEPAFLGEVFVSEFLGHVLGSAYDPNIHWTSHFRNRLGHTPFRAQENSPMSGFYIDARTGQAMTDFLRTNSIEGAAAWAYLPPDYRIDVQTTVDGTSASFSWSPLDFDMARRWRIRGSSHQQDHIYILIRVSNVYGKDPHVRMFVDPWGMIQQEELLIKAPSNLVASIPDSAPLGIELSTFQSKIPQPRYDPFSRMSRFLGSAISRQRSKDTSNVYTWEPLNEAARQIRLLYLLPGKGTEDLRGKLTVSTIRDRPEYDAISYTWGSALHPFTLHTSEGIIPITTSLYLALRRMRKRNKSRWVWVDAICINQSDSVEKPSQISMMPDIFRSATRVYAWIGEEEDESLAVLRTLEQIDHAVPSRGGDEVIPRLGSTFWDDLGKLLERKWFRRIWVVQEIVLARDIIVMCGNQRVPWGRFCDTLSRLFYHAEQSSSGLFLSRGSTAGSVLRLAAFRKACWEGGDFEAKYQLLSLFEHFQWTEATQRRDKLFALLNLARDNCQELRPDYEAPLKDIIWRYARTFVNNGYVMELLYRSGRSAISPSWVPDWTSAPYPRSLSKWRCKTAPHKFTAGNGFPLSFHLRSGRVLCLRGHLVDRVSRVGKCPSYTSVFPAYRQEISTMVDKWFRARTPEETAIVKWRLPIGDCDIESEQPRTSGNLNDAWAGESREYMAAASDFADIFSPAVACGTEMRKVGIVPKNTQTGDRIAVFHGSVVPFIIRKTETPDGHYRVIGECYIDGMMHGEYMDSSGQCLDISLV
ncbi:hypothetical protein ABOM_007286 [Aspergillus bombycis]|uniref:Heterokaryon incompatibility domain-containing protein n=1 Tax=Aspergillus bombycis TaxID=109264 RepID=A0A1F7ZXB7_9EURO|nr:hypothetical protein ABOM_007286 [Aspergillus bombycis]OGM44113.1 hypothetical protein ABOM_007286 [Aspergillus bombycis]